ncbi:carbonic anhydrase family protein [Gimesia chilikensis]|uniref:Carbonic anhydrase n=1 Tax=Gimesia chilikensis TaxID=2605989 RepID=A0A517PYD3_9PLAN|nr:carbonic anhydrase family protein [Gimesia chilikensis]QDT24396.1 Eukaryotic-type carbonic anhydrase [Gimesia chilikensis]
MTSESSYMPQQSPINLIQASTIRVQLPAEYLEIKYPNEPLSGHFDHDFYFDDPPETRFEGMSACLERIHIHSRSEHLVDGQDFDFEIHFVHPLPVKIPETGEQRYLVLGVFFKENAASKTSKSIRILNDYFKANPESISKDSRGDDPPPQASINPCEFLPSDCSRFFRYEGSLTTPHKDSTSNPEIVSWVVFTELVEVNPEDVADLKQSAQDTARKPQEIYRRFILRNFE